MFFLNELKDLKLYRRQVVLPLNEKNKRKNSVAFLLHPELFRGLECINSMIIPKYYNCYYVERSMLYYITQENSINELTNRSQIMEESYLYDEDSSKIGSIADSFALGENAAIYLPESDIESIHEDATTTLLKKMYKNNRLKNNKALRSVYDSVKENYPFIKRTLYDISKYNEFNLFIDLSYYMNAYIKNNTFKNKRGYSSFISLLKKLLNDSRVSKAGYNNKCVIIPVDEWIKVANTEKYYLINNSVNPLSIIYYSCLNNNLQILKDTFGDSDVLFIGASSYMIINFGRIEKLKSVQFLKLIQRIHSKEYVEDDAADPKSYNKLIDPYNHNPIDSKSEISSPAAIKMNIIDKLEKSQKLIIDDISMDDIPDDADQNTKAKKEIVKTISNKASAATTEDDTLDMIDQDKEDAERLKQLLSDLATSPDDRGSDISGARASRMTKLQDDFLDSTFEGKSVKEIVNSTADTEEKPKPLKLKVDSINQEWQNLTFAPTLESYDLESDIVRIFNCFSSKSNPLVIRELNKVDTSVTGNLVYTYTCKYESAKGTRYTIIVDIPKFVDGKYMVLHGNRKNIPIQLFLMPIIKTEEGTVQIVSNYNKIFIRRFGTSQGKSNPMSDKFIKAVMNGKYKDVSIVYGDNTKVCSKYELPIDYIDMAGTFSRIETKNIVIEFNQDVLHETLKIDDAKGLCFGYYKQSKEPLYFKPDPKKPVYFSTFLMYVLDTHLSEKDRDVFKDEFKKASLSVRYCYSRAKLLGVEIPLIVICGLAVGLEKTLTKAKIKYSIHTKRPSYDIENQDIIKFKDGYLLYELDYASGLLMNGLKQCPTDMHSITNINTRIMYLDFLENFGGRIKADGLDNFQDCMIDPITEEVLKHYKLPTDYVDVLLHANLLLSDNKFVKHGNIRSSRRMRRIEQIAAYLYSELAKSYGTYSTGLKHGRNTGFTLGRENVIKSLLVGNTTDDQSILNALGEYEAYYAVTPKGLSGMNEDRSFSLDKRSFDDSMMNIMSSSTGFANTVGIARQATIDPNIEGSRGYIYNDPENINEINAVKTLCMTESVTPFTATRDDPMRLAMGFVQTSKHGMRCEKSDPALITTGADEALPYLISNTFAYKTKENGVVVELDPNDHMVIQHGEGNGATFEYVNLADTVQKNSSSGFFVTLKLDTDLKVGSKVKAGQIVAYDKSSFNSEMGYDDNIAYNIGTLAKFAILNTDEGFEDSAIISDDLSEGLASDIVLAEELNFDKNTNIYNMVEKGQHVNEGDPLMIIQDAYEDADLNVLLKNLKGDESEVTDLGRKKKTSKVTGVIQDIIIERTAPVEELSPTLKKIVKKYESNINARRNVMKKYKIEDSNKILQDTETMEPTGTLKACPDGVKITIYMKYHDKFSVGCKLIYGTAVKGVCKEIFEKGEEPYSEYRKDEKIHALLSIGSINARMATSVLVTTGINKALIELSRRCKDMAGIKYDVNML